ncbi:hypothetical protein CHS0354_007982 [Potamilus streckersoni]|uniref:Cyclic nucleotide-binding domain-containing protein n=1 Tax=Potamilus streckersoni TaxID=2493646 RepID=A0AAE0VSZ9_9BIVA|nr:hypothetical protein CHS0354_007982 [Potamilus streckersoni]
MPIAYGTDPDKKVLKLGQPEITINSQADHTYVDSVSLENAKIRLKTYEDIVQLPGMKENHIITKESLLGSRRHIQSAPVSIQNSRQPRLIYLHSDGSTSAEGPSRPWSTVPRTRAEQRQPEPVSRRGGCQRPWTAVSGRSDQQVSSACRRSNLTSAASSRTPLSHLVPPYLSNHVHTTVRLDGRKNGGWLASPVNNEDKIKCISGKDISKYHLLKKLKSQKSQRRQRNLCSRDNAEQMDSELKAAQLAIKKLPSDLLMRFRKGAVTILNVQRLMEAMKQLSDSMTSRSATEEQWQALYGNARAQELVFNKAAFAKDKAYNKMPAWALRLMDTAPEERTEDDLNKLHALLRNIKSFDKFTQKIQISMCRAFRYQSVESGRIVLRKGHVGQNFYFIHSGSVFVNVDDVNIYGESFVKTEVVLKTGDSFGELALLQDIRRTATISVRETCELLVVDKDTFARVCPKLFEKELDEKRDFLSHLELFSKRVWSKESIQNLCLEAQIQEYKTNRVIVADSAEDEWIYICMEGECQVIRRLWVDNDTPKKMTGPQLNSSPNTVVSEHFLEIIKTFGDKNTSKDGDNISDPVNTEQGKERLLNSMGLEYVRSRKLSLEDIRNLMRKQLQKQLQKDEENKDTGSNSVIYGPLTLTSLIAQAEKSFVGKKMVYLIVKIMGGTDVFALHSILDDSQTYISRTKSINSFILVSCGVRVLRIKRSCFFKYACPEALNHAKTLAAKQRYPSDAVLYNSYRDHIFWDQYKQELVRQVIAYSVYNKINSVESKRLRSRNVVTRDSNLSRADQKLMEEVFLSTKCVIPEVKPTDNRQRNSSIVTGTLRKPYPPSALHRDKGRYSQRQTALKFKTIEEDDEQMNDDPPLDRNVFL